MSHIYAVGGHMRWVTLWRYSHPLNVLHYKFEVIVTIVDGRLINLSLIYVIGI